MINAAIDRIDRVRRRGKATARRIDAAFIKHRGYLIQPTHPSVITINARGEAVRHTRALPAPNSEIAR